MGSPRDQIARKFHLSLLLDLGGITGRSTAQHRVAQAAQDQKQQAKALEEQARKVREQTREARDKAGVAFELAKENFLTRFPKRFPTTGPAPLPETSPTKQMGPRSTVQPSQLEVPRFTPPKPPRI